MHQNNTKGNLSTWITFKWAELNDISAALQSLSVGIHPLSPSAALWSADTAPCSIWPTATPTERENATCVQSPLVPAALLYTDGGIFIYMAGDKPRHYSADLSDDKTNGLSVCVRWWWESLEGITVVRDKGNARGWRAEMFWLGAAGRSNSGGQAGKP